VVTALLVLLALASLFSADRQDSVLGRNLDILGLETRELQLDPQLAFGLLDVHRRRPAHAVARERIFEEPVDLAAEPENG
jgi:hypothetical protein